MAIYSTDALTYHPATDLPDGWHVWDDTLPEPGEDLTDVLLTANPVKGQPIAWNVSHLVSA